MPSISSIVVLLSLCFLTACQTTEIKNEIDADRAADSTVTRKPNIVFIIVDDMGWPDTEVYGHSFHETPYINRLANEGMVFTNAYAASPVCSSTRASIQSGQYPARTGITDYIPGHMRVYEQLSVPTNRTQYLPLEIETLAEVLKQGGYRSAYFGKWHLEGFKTKYYPGHQGYDEFVVRAGGGHYGTKFFPPQAQVNSERNLSEILTDFSVEFIERNKQHAFFLTLSHFAVHIPLQADEEKVEKYKQKEKPSSGVNHPVYAAMVEHVDDSVGRILDTLKQHELDQNTLVLFYSDNGGLIKMFNGKGDTVSTNAPLRSEKGSLYEGGIRVPFIARWPGTIEAGQRSSSFMTSPDLLPTFAAMADVEVPKHQVLDGVNLLPAFRGENLERSLFFHYPHYHHSSPASAVREGRYKLIQFFEDGRLELYDLESDIGETNNIAKDKPDITGRLLNRLITWRQSIGAELPKSNPQFDPGRRYEWSRHPDHPRYHEGK